MGQAGTFLTELWRPPLTRGAIRLWQKSNERTYSFDDVEAAALWAEQLASSSDIYIAAGLWPGKAKPAKGRGKAADVVGIPGLWIDIDINGGPDAHTDAAPDRAAAVEVAESLGIAPTLLVNSGYGLQAWWLFEEPWTFSMEAEREQAATLMAAWNSALRAQANERGIKKLDSVFDLARLMRLPGTQNHKGAEPVPVTLDEDYEGPRWDLGALTGVADAFMSSSKASAIASLSGADVSVKVGGTPPHERIEDLREAIPDFDSVWRHSPNAKRKGWSLSHYDMAIANYCVQAGFSDQEIGDTIAYHRRRYQDASGKGERVDYLQRTIAKARASSQYEEAEAEEELEREHAAEELARVAKGGGNGGGTAATASVTMSLFNKICGGPAIKELVQDGRDPDLARFHLVLADGREVPLGAPSGLIQMERFRERFAVVTGHLPRRTKKWDDIVQALLTAATVREGKEDTRAARVLGWLDAYLDRRTSQDRDTACQVLDPFEHDGEVFVPLGPFNQWLRKVRGERISDVDLKLMMEAAGFERRTINYHRDTGKKSSRSYFVAPKDLLESAAA